MIHALNTSYLSVCDPRRGSTIKTNTDPTPLKSKTLPASPSDIPSPSSCQHVRPPHPQQCVGFQQSVSASRFHRCLLISFPGPFTQLVKKVLLVSNQNSSPVAFKVKTTAPKVRIPLSEQVIASLRHPQAVLRSSQFG